MKYLPAPQLPLAKHRSCPYLAFHFARRSAAGLLVGHAWDGKRFKAARSPQPIPSAGQFGQPIIYQTWVSGHLLAVYKIGGISLFSIALNFDRPCLRFDLVHGARSLKCAARHPAVFILGIASANNWAMRVNYCISFLRFVYGVQSLANAIINIYGFCRSAYFG
jgi:hypothetical protein